MWAGGGITGGGGGLGCSTFLPALNSGGSWNGGVGGTSSVPVCSGSWSAWIIAFIFLLSSAFCEDKRSTFLPSSWIVLECCCPNWLMISSRRDLRRFDMSGLGGIRDCGLFPKSVGCSWCFWLCSESCCAGIWSILLVWDDGCRRSKWFVGSVRQPSLYFFFRGNRWRLAPNSEVVVGESFLLLVVVSLDVCGDDFLLTVGASMVIVRNAALGARSLRSFDFVRLDSLDLSMISVSAPPGVTIIDALCSRSILSSPESFSSELLCGRGAFEGPISVPFIFVGS